MTSEEDNKSIVQVFHQAFQTFIEQQEKQFLKLSNFTITEEDHKVI